MMNLLSNLARWQKVAAAILATYSLWNIVPSSIKPMTRGAHDSDAAYTKENFAARNIHFFEKKLCKGIKLAPEQHMALQEAYEKYLESTGKAYYLAEMSKEDKCSAVND